ncbi:MAG: serine hydrolase domain-containing protein [Pseudomonadota bacterium]
MSDISAVGGNAPECQRTSTGLRTLSLRLVLLFLLLAAAAVPGYATSSTPHAEQPTPLPADLARPLREIQTTNNIPVLAVTIIQPAQTASAVWGANRTTPLRWGSITKTITALTTLALAEQGKLNLNDPLAIHIPDTAWHNAWRQTDPVRVHHLLELTAGFPDLSSIEFNYPSALTLQAALALNPAHRQTLWPPGQQHVYSNMAPGLTQLLIETVSNSTFDAAAQALVLQPLGMHGASFSPDPDLPGGFQADGTTPIAYWHMVFPAFGALNGSLSDLTRLLSYLMQGAADSTVMSALRRDALFQAKTSLAAKSGLAFGYGAGLYPRVRRGHVWFGHGGDADGYRSRLAFASTLNSGYVININTDNPAALRRVERLVETYLSRTAAPPAKPAPIVVSQATLASLVGTYYPTGSRFGLARWRQGLAAAAEVSLNEAGFLEFRRGERQTPLLPIKQSTTTLQLRRQNDPEATVIFLQAAGQVLLQGELGNYVQLPGCPDYMQAINRCNQATRSAQ